MNMTRCKNGHFYDGDKYDRCPHCNALGDSQKVGTVPIGSDGSETTVSIDSKGTIEDEIEQAITGPEDFGDTQKTVSFIEKKFGKEPVVGWLVAIEGEHFGEDFRLKSGRNFIGRSKDMDVSLSKDNSVSRNKHAILLYEPKQNVYIVQPGDSKELFYLNEKVVIGAETINRNDVLSIGESKFMFIPCCDDAFTWKKEND